MAATAEAYITKNQELPNPTTRSVELFADDLRNFGLVRPETAQAVIDEELTNAAEDTAKTKSGYGVVPRTYYQRGETLVDKYQNDLVEIFDDGIEWCQEEVLAGKPGAGWELERRRADRDNLDKILTLSSGEALIEISSTPLDKPQHERETQGYNGMTHVRVSAKEADRVEQSNFFLPTSEPHFLLRLQSLVGMPLGQRTISSQQLLERPITTQLNVKEIESLIGVALLDLSPDHAILAMVKKAASARREAWEFVSSDEHGELRRELERKISELASLPSQWWLNGINDLRKGFLKELRERYDGNVSAAKYGEVIGTAAAQAVADGDVFITCGGAIESTAPVASGSSRSSVANKLRNEVKGSGTCTACGAAGPLYGCGVFCKACNDVWCDKYLTGEQLSAKQIRYLRHVKLAGRANETKQWDFFEELARYWHQLKREAAAKKLTEKQSKEGVART